jgi:ABC-type transporter Mla MlaB component
MKKRKKSTTPRSPRKEADSPPVADVEEKATDATFAVAAECTVADAASLKSELGKLLDQEATVTLDVGSVQRIDTAGLQVIAAFVRERETHGRNVVWQGTTPAFSNAVELLGLGSLLSWERS